jgi:hypothetical protein
MDISEMSIYIMGEEVTLNEMSIYIMGEQATLNEMSIYIMEEQVTLKFSDLNFRAISPLTLLPSCLPVSGKTTTTTEYML